MLISKSIYSFKVIFALSLTSVIYHYCVIVEMFCIGLYARHTFRKVEPITVEDEERPISMTETAVQTEDIQKTHPDPGRPSEEVWPAHYLSGASNPSYSNTEDSLCKIEHAPLEGFPFPPTRSQRLHRPQPVELRSATEPGADVTHITVRADVNYQDSKDVTVVWQTKVDLKQKTKWVQALTLKWLECVWPEELSGDPDQRPSVAIENA